MTKRRFERSWPNGWSNTGFRVEQAGSGEEALERLSGLCVRHPDHGSAACPASTAARCSTRRSPVPGHHCHRHHRLRHRARSRRGHADRAPKASSPSHSSSRSCCTRLNAAIEKAAARSRERLSAGAAPRSLPDRRHRGPHAGDAAALRAAADRGGDVEHGAGDRRDRHWQGTGRARDSRRQPAAQQSVSSRSTAARFPRRCSRPSCSAMFVARSRAPSPTGRAGSNRPIAARCSSTKSGR